jgi:putative transposase
MLYGKRKLKRIYQRRYKEEISTWKIERVIRKHNLYPDKKKIQDLRRKLIRNKLHPRLRINKLERTKEDAQRFGFLWHIDSIILNFDDTRRAIITAIDDVAKVAYARMYVSNNSRYTKDFLQRLLYLTEGNIQMLHTDNGSEFDGFFNQAIEELNIPRVYSRPHTPKDNPINERFNRTLQEEWLMGAIFKPDDVDEANRDLTEWLIEYNTVRPHQTLKQLTPLEYVEENYLNSKVLPMYPAHTPALTNYRCYGTIRSQNWKL